MMLMSMGWKGRRDGKCLSDLDLFGGGESGVHITGCKCWQSCIAWFCRGGICDIYCSGFPNIGVRFDCSSSSDIIDVFSVGV